MDKNYTDITKRISGDLKKLRNDIPDTMQAFSALASSSQIRSFRGWLSLWCSA